MDITQDKLKELFEYDGTKLYWKIDNGKSKKGQPCGSINKSDGYLRTGIGQKQYCNHRIIYLMVNGSLPKYLDHKDGNRINNTIENLRPATLIQNGMNRTNSTITNPYRNVSFHKKCKKYQVMINLNKKSHYLGLFETAEEANEIAKKFRIENFGIFYRGEL